MKRQLSILAVAALVAVMMVVLAAPAMARVSSFIASSEGTQLRLSQPAFPTDPYRPASRQAPSDPYAHAPNFDRACSPGSNPTCPTLP